MPPPTSVPITKDQLRAIGRRFGLRAGQARLLEPPGIINDTYALDGRHVLRVPRQHPAHVEQIERETSAIPAVVAAGVRTPDVIAYDESREILPVPYLIVERLHGRNLEVAWLEPSNIRHVWRALGRDLARVHATPPPARLAAFAPDEYDAILARDPRELVELRAAEGWFSAMEVRWLVRWLDRLPAPRDDHSSRRLVHADVQMSKFMIERTRDRYQAIFDWGCARVADTAMDFLSMPIAAVPQLLAGHREIAPLPEDETAEARILWRRLQMLFYVLPRGAARGQAWGERPIAWLIDLMRFFTGPPRLRWRDIAPLA